MNDGRNRLLIVAMFVLVLVAAGLWLLGGEAPAATPEAPPPPAADVELPVVVTAPAPQQAASPERVAAAPAPVAVAAVDPTLAHVRGRCVDENGAPLGQCMAKFDAWGGNSSDMALQGRVDWQDPEPIVTGDDGRFEFAFAPPSGMQFSLDVQKDGRVPRTGRWGTIAPAQVIDLGDIPLAVGFEVTGRVVDEQGVPVARVGVHLDNLPLPLAPGMGSNDSRHGFSSANGEFRIAAAIPLGTWSLGADTRGYRLISPDHVTVTERGAEPVLVTVRAMPTITGLVVDEAGLPVEGVGIEAVLDRSGRMADGRSRQDGTFTIAAVDADPTPVRLAILDPGPCEPSWHDERMWEWGTKDVRIQVRRALSFELTVVERGTGAPVTAYAISCYSDEARSSRQMDLRLSGEHEGGRVLVDRVWRGRNFLQVTPIDKRLLQSDKLEFEVGDAGIAAMRVELDRLQPASVRVTDAGGAPQIGSKVEIVRKGSDAFDVAAWAQDSRGGSSGFSTDPKHRFHELLSAGSTDAEGRAELFVPPGASGLAVRVTGRHPPAIADPAVFVPGHDFAVVVPEGGGITGRVHFAGLDPARMTVQLQRTDGAPMPRLDNRDGSVQADGRFAAHGLLPGTYRLAVQYAVHYSTDHGSSGGGMPLDVEVPNVVVAAGHDSEVDIDGTALVPATVRGRLLLDGVVPSPARAFVRAEGGATWGQFVPGSDGVFEATGLLPGSYRVGLVVGDFQAGEGDTILQEDTFVLAAGQQLARDFAFTRRRLSITILEADGKTPAAGLLVYINGRTFYKRSTTDGKGVLVIDPAPPGQVQVQAIGRGPLPPVEVPLGKTEDAVTVTLPAAKEK